MSYYPEFANFIENHLAKKDRSASWLASQLKVDPSTVGRWLNDHARPGSTEVVLKIADVLRIEKSELLIAAGYGYKEMSDIEDQAVEGQPKEDIDNSPQKKTGGGNHFKGDIKIYGDIIEGSTVRKTVYYSTDNAAAQKKTEDIIQDEDNTKSG